jgi:hypothetical protein
MDQSGGDQRLHVAVDHPARADAERAAELVELRRDAVTGEVVADRGIGLALAVGQFAGHGPPLVLETFSSCQA